MTEARFAEFHVRLVQPQRGMSMITSCKQLRTGVTRVPCLSVSDIIVMEAAYDTAAEE